MKDVLIIAPFADLPDETGNCRYFYLANEISKNNEVKVELVISAFSHLKKQQRDTSKTFSSDYKLTYIAEPGYKRNVSLKRFRSHNIMGKNLKEYIGKREKPDVVLCAVPSLDAACVAAEYCEQNGVKFVIDVQDLWPEAFQMVFNVPVLSDIIFAPFKRDADYIYSRADEIVAVSETYADRAARVNNKASKTVVFLGTKIVDFDKFAFTGEKDKNIFKIGYVGTLGHSYNITCVIKALEILKMQGYENIQFDVMGDGPLMEEFKSTAKVAGVNVVFHGRLPYPEMVSELTKCHIAVNPIVKGAAQSIINKVGDYAAAGLAVVNTQECPEYRDLINSYGFGFTSENDDIKGIAENILTLYKDEELRENMGSNNRRLALERFDRAAAYNAVIELLLED